MFICSYCIYLIICVFLFFFSKLYKLESFYYIRNLFIALLIDGLIFDDEPLWEPLEWSLLQTWILYLYVFSWCAEVIFSSRYGSYTNRDKIVWLGLFKVYYYILYWFFINMLIVTVFVTLPFYFEITYAISYSVVWWNWFTSSFFFKITTLFSLILVIALFLKFNLRWINLNTLYLFLLFILIIIFYIFTFSSFFLLISFFTDISEFRNTGWSNLNKITQGPLKWSWGLDSRDHFAYHKTPSSFWFKNDPLISSSLLFINLIIFLYLFFLILQVLAVLRTIFASNNISHNLFLFFFATLKQFYYFILLLQILVWLSYLYQFMRYPFELYWFTKFYNLIEIEYFILSDILTFLLI